MKKIKVILLFVFVFVLCGCNATYNLEITSAGLSEELIIDGNYAELDEVGATREDLQYRFYDLSVDYDNPILEGDVEEQSDDSVIKYNKVVETNDNGYIAKYSYDKFNASSFQKSGIAKSAYTALGYVTNVAHNYIQLSTNQTKIFEAYPLLDSITINIKPSYKVEESNADSVNDGVYTWKLSRDTNKSIVIRMRVNPDKESTISRDERNNNESPNSDPSDNQNNVNNKNDSESDSNVIKKNSKLVTIICLVGFIGVLIYFIFIKR